MSLMAEKLAFVKKQRRLTTEGVSRLSGVPVGTLNKIFSGQTRHPAAEHLDKIARALRVSVHYLLDDTLPPDCCFTAGSEEGAFHVSQEEMRLLLDYRRLEAKGRQALLAMTALLLAPIRGVGPLPVRRLPCYGTAPEGGRCLLRPILLPQLDEAARRAEFAVLVPDGSMEPICSSGAVLLCRWQARRGQEYALFLLNQQPLVRRLCRRGDRVVLVSPNLDYRDIPVTEADCLRYVGSVIGIASSFRWEHCPPVDKAWKE